MGKGRTQIVVAGGKPRDKSGSTSLVSSHYKKLKSRVGSQYQTKVPKVHEVALKTYVPMKRPAPALMSADNPHISQDEYKTGIESIDISHQTAAVHDNVTSHGKIQRSGGHLLHKASSRNQQDQFLWTCQQLMIPSPPQQMIMNTAAFQQEMIQLYGQTGRRPKKRRTMDRRQTLTSRPFIPKPMPSEHDEPMLEYYQSLGDLADLQIRVDLQQGQVAKARRSLHRELHTGRFRRPEGTSTASWRQRYDRTLTNMAGDYRPHPSLQNYPWRHNNTTQQLSNSLGNNLHFKEDNQNGVWRCILAFGQALEKDTKPAISEVMDYLSFSYHMDVHPEQVFGRHHVCVESIAKCMNSLLNKVSDARDAQAELLDYLFKNAEEGVDVETLRKLTNDVDSKSPLKLGDLLFIRKKIESIHDWQKRVDSLEGEDQLTVAEHLVREAKSGMLRTKNLAALEKRIQRAHQLQQRLDEWDKHKAKGQKQSYRFVTALVRDANRIQLPSQKATELLEFNKQLDGWIDRANIAIRSRLSLSEIEGLITRAFTMPLDLSEWVDKLESRARMARQWILELETYVPRREPFSEWMKTIRTSKDENRLQDLACEGARIPVEMNHVKMLQLELEAKNWSAKARRWTPGCEDSKKGKLEDLREHLRKGQALRSRLLIEDKDGWVLDCEEELTKIVRGADRWFEQFSQYLEWDNRRPSTRKCLAFCVLRSIVHEANNVFVSFGSATNKMVKVLAQAENWFERFGHLIKKTSGEPHERGVVSQQELSDAIQAASSDIAVDLEEAIALQKICDKMKQWFERASFAAPKRSKRVGTGRWATKVVRYRIDDLVGLIEEASVLPAETGAEVSRLKRQLNDVQTWRIKANNDLKALVNGFRALGEAIEGKYGSGDFTFGKTPRNGIYIEVEEAKDTVDDPMEIEPATGGEKKGQLESTGSASCSDVNTNDECTEGSEGESSQIRISTGKSSNYNNNIIKLINSVLSEGKQSGVLTVEEELASDLEKVAKWCFKSLKFLEKPRDVYDKRTQKAFDTFVQSGETHLNTQSEHELDDKVLTAGLASSWKNVVKSQLMRLKKLQKQRDRFAVWSKSVQPIISGKEKKIAFKVLEELAKESHQFPANMVQRVRNLYHRILRWRNSVSSQLKSGQKIEMNVARVMFEEGEKLEVVCDEMKVLRKEIKTTRVWLAKIKKSKVEEGGASASDVEKLIAEHDKLLISVPDEVEKLSQAMKGYCVCRRPYEGFMIGCDECGEWYHGSCIGVSETQAGRYEKFICIRCGVLKVFTKSCTSVANVIKKWTSIKSFKKARASEAQKHRRKVRKERGDIEKYEKEIEECHNKLRPPDEQSSLAGDGVLEQNNGCSGAKDAPSSKIIATMSTQRIQAENTTHSEACVLDGITGVKAEKTQSVGNALSLNLASQIYQGASMQKLTAEENTLQVGIGETPMVDHTSGMSDVENCKARPITPEMASELRQKIVELGNSIISCKERLEKLNQEANDRAVVDDKEEKCRELLKIWCIRARKFVLVPSTSHQAERSRPCDNGDMSPPMVALFRDAEALGIAKLPDVHVVANALRCISWSCLAMLALSTKIRKEEIENLVNRSDSLSLPDGKALKTMKGMLLRTNQWQAKVQKALAPKPGETKPFMLDELRSLDSASSGLPFEVAEMNLLSAAMEDKGCRHCLCGGANDGLFMLSCDKCELWFHGRCVNVDKATGEQLDSWLCPHCRGQKDFMLKIDALQFNFSECEKDEDECPNRSDEIVPCAPLPKNRWPPYGLLPSLKAKDALGEDCVNIDDSVGEWEGFRLNDKQVLPMAAHLRLNQDVSNMMEPMTCTSVGKGGALLNTCAKPKIMMTVKSAVEEFRPQSVVSADANAKDRIHSDSTIDFEQVAVCHSLGPRVEENRNHNTVEVGEITGVDHIVTPELQNSLDAEESGADDEDHSSRMEEISNRKVILISLKNSESTNASSFTTATRLEEETSKSVQSEGFALHTPPAWTPTVSSDGETVVHNGTAKPPQVNATSSTIKGTPPTKMESTNSSSKDDEKSQENGASSLSHKPSSVVSNSTTVRSPQVPVK